ncbi:hypothetical protein MVES1_001671 [Malassezia vespertilionis]|uniref:DNA polymerase delta subunit 3 n=1 Tax=Malassezia vespertilionis TaxID=2020962 RepID=A0A2N1JDQ3_9BASI|nr:uncharacterized protein MVES1_001671 [Malassezia vespertilionis]PKI84656.1 hypothetical protein MVES_001572 [Malassezia vespertilionis]WFD06326.1 hypothetical protein MVES1_001671 [Malassezia vespertilionis]
MAERDFLVARVLHDKGAVTYKILSRALGIHVDAARSALQTFYDQHTTLYAIYMVTGRSADTECIELVGKDALDACLAKYTNAQYQMYAVQPHAKYDAPLLASAVKQVMYEPDAPQRHNGTLGILTNTRIVQRNGPPGAAPCRVVSASVPSVLETPRTEQAASAPAPAPKAQGTGRVRKKRKVVRKVKVKNERGYTVTQDVEEYESYSEDELAESDKAASKPKPKKAQPSLTSFFAKQQK